MVVSSCPLDSRLRGNGDGGEFRHTGNYYPTIPAEAGIHKETTYEWIPACAGMALVPWYPSLSCLSCASMLMRYDFNEYPRI